MRYIGMIHRCLAVILCVLLVVAMVPAVTALAADYGSCSLSIDYFDEETPITDVSFRVYRVANLLDHWKCEFTGPYTGYPIKFGLQMTNSEWVTIAEKLAEYTTEKHIDCSYSGKTDQRGSFAINNVPEGLYLVEGDTTKINGIVYTPQTFCVVIPDRDENNNLINDVHVTPKFETENDKKYGDLTVTKTVAGNGNKEREWNFTVTLNDKAISGTYGDMRFEEGIAKITLKHGEAVTAKKLPAGIKYNVEEEKVDGYTVASTGETGTIVADKETKAVFVNTPIPNVNTNDGPKTGDNNSLLELTLWATIALEGVFISFVALRKKRKNSL